MSSSSSSKSYSTTHTEEKDQRIYAEMGASVIGAESPISIRQPFTKEVAEKINIISNHTYTQEQIIKAVRGKYKIKEVPIYFAKRKDKSRLISNPFTYATRAWINIIRIYRDYKPLKFFGIIGTLIFFMGFILGLYLIYIQLFGEGVNRHLGLMMLNTSIPSLLKYLILTVSTYAVSNLIVSFYRELVKSKILKNQKAKCKIEEALLID